LSRLTRRLGIAIGPEIPRATIAPLSIVPITLVVAVLVVAVLERAIGPRTSVLKSVALTILPGCKAPSIAAALTLALVRRPLDERLWGVRRTARWGLKSLLRLRESLLPLRRRGETIRHPAKIAVIVEVVLILSRRPLLTALCERLCSLRRCNKPIVMFGVLQVILRCNRVPTCVSISCKLEVFFRDVMRVAAYFDVWSIRFIGSRQRIGPAPIVCRPAAHPLILTWSHFNFLISIRLAQSFSDRFGANVLEFGARERRFTPSRHSNGLISSHPTYGHDRSHSSQSRANFPYQRRPWPRLDHRPTSGRPFCRPFRLTLFRCFRHPSSDQIIHIGWGRKAEAAKLALPTNPFQTE
jgi:hypothetical protein